MCGGATRGHDQSASAARWLAELLRAGGLTIGASSPSLGPILGNDAVGNVYFAGEHANSFYVWQGFMEGAALSGVDAAAAILKRALA